MVILHLATAADWTAAVASGRYAVSTHGATLEQVGFIHCSTPDQLAEVAGAVWAGSPDELVVLELEEETLREAGLEVRYEDGGNGTPYPHLYGAIDPAWVRSVRPGAFDAAGVFRRQ
ncbi:hypothetical protein GCM10023081_38800 [Arthrobacter ginkgonis]|uniref:DUF952 domain-containing protein n=1 Tax=Arthrobacter ginkgonis TaxID=1630594 RepID=A0ABP7D1E2_9MICC